MLTCNKVQFSHKLPVSPVKLLAIKQMTRNITMCWLIKKCLSFAICES